MAGNPVLGFLNVQPTGDGPHATVTKMLRLLGIVILVGFVVGLIGNLLLLTMGATYYDGPAAGLAAAGAVGGIIIGLLITGAVLFWITYTINAWTTGQPNGATHVLVIGILATVFGGLGLLGLLGLFAATAFPVYLVINLVSVLVAAGELYCGIMILTNRSKTGTGTGRTMGAAN
jgi:hypothetical protein